MMKSAERMVQCKALVSFLGFLQRGPAVACAADSGDAQPRLALHRSDGAKRTISQALIAHCLSAGLLSRRSHSNEPATSYALTASGQMTLRRLLADPDSAFQDQHRHLASRKDKDLGTLTVNELESPLAALARIKGKDGQRFLTPEQVEAGERLRADFTRGQLTPALGQRWDPVRTGRSSGSSGGIADLTDAALSARQRLEAATSAVGPELSGVLLDACCFLKGLTDIERERQWPARSAKLMLRTALSILSRHYAAPRQRRQASDRSRDIG